MNVTLNVNARTVIDGLVSRYRHVHRNRTRIRTHFISQKHFNVFAHVLSNVLSKRPHAYILSVEQSQSAAALTDADHDLFLFGWSCALIEIAALAADVRFVHFNL